MKLHTIKKAFTLIELLVVITIIGILATWATTVYTSQIQKARDSTRLTDITALRGWAEQFYQDKGQYPYTTNTNNTFPAYNFGWIKIYTPKLPEDPKSWETTANSSFDYIYTVWEDDNNITWQDYEFSTTFENTWNIENKAGKDWWGDDYRVEIWVDIEWNATNVSGAISSSVASLQCVAADWIWITCATESVRLLIRNQ